jgi:hypothetical protein
LLFSLGRCLASQRRVFTVRYFMVFFVGPVVLSD